MTLNRGAPDSSRRPPEVVAPFANAVVVLALPVAVFLIVPFLPEDQSTVSARVSPIHVIVVREALGFIALLLPFIALAGIVAWRTQIHARRYLRGDGAGWRGVLEGGAAGLASSLVVLLPAVIRSPLRAIPYLVVYGGGATIAGLVAGLLLRATALLALQWFTGSRDGNSSA